jgi:hypothetical protein
MTTAYCLRNGAGRQQIAGYFAAAAGALNGLKPRYRCCFAARRRRQLAALCSFQMMHYEHLLANRCRTT